MNKEIIKVLVITIGLVVIYAAGFASGHAWCKSGQQGAIQDSINDGKKAVEEIRKTIKQRTKEVKTHVDRIQIADDPTGCADTALAPNIDDELYKIYQLTSGSEVDRRLPVREVPGTGTTGNTSK